MTGHGVRLRDYEEFVRLGRLDRLEVFEGFSPRDRMHLYGALGGRMMRYRKGETVCAEGEKLDCFGVVLEGAVEAGFSGEGYYQMISRFEEGETFAEAVAVLEGASPVEIRAVEDSEVMLLSAGKMIGADADARVRAFEVNFMRSMAAKMLKLNLRLRTLRDPQLQRRVLCYLERLPRTGEGTVTLPFSRTELADYLGVQRTSLSRALHAMEAEGIVELDGRNIKLLENRSATKGEETMIDRTKTMRELCSDEPLLEGFLQGKGFPFSADNPITELVTLEDVASVQSLDLDAFLDEFREFKRAREEGSPGSATPGADEAGA